MEKFDRLFNEQHPETVFEGWLDLPEDQPFRLTDATFGQSNFADKDTGDYSTNCILSLEDNRGSARWVWSCNSLIALLEKELPLESCFCFACHNLLRVLESFMLYVKVGNGR